MPFSFLTSSDRGAAVADPERTGYRRRAENQSQRGRIRWPPSVRDL